MGKVMDRTLLTPKEIETLDLVDQGLTRDQIAEKLHISIWTVNSRLTSIKVRMRAKGQQK